MSLDEEQEDLDNSFQDMVLEQKGEKEKKNKMDLSLDKEQEEEKNLDNSLQDMGLKQKGEKIKGDISLDEEQEVDLDDSFQDPDYKYKEYRGANILSSSSSSECEMDDDFMSRKLKGVKRKSRCETGGAGGGQGRGAGRNLFVVAGDARRRSERRARGGKPKKKGKGIERY